MELIRETALFTSLLHCALAISLPTDYPSNHYVPVSYIPDKGILPTPYSEIDKIDLPRPSYLMIPSWHHTPNKPEVNNDEKKSQAKKSTNTVHEDVAKNRRKPELDIMQNVKLGLTGLSGMVAKYKKDQGPHVTGPEIPTVVIKPGKNRSKPDGKDKLVKYKAGQPMFTPENTDIPIFKDIPISYRYTAPANLVDDVKPTNYDYSSYTSMSYDDTPEKIYRSTPGIKSQAIHTSPYNDKPVAQKPTFNYGSTQPISKDKQVELPPVPKTMPLLRRVYIALLNTISGLPGGNTAVLDSVRAG